MSNITSPPATPGTDRPARRLPNRKSGGSKPCGSASRAGAPLAAAEPFLPLRRFQAAPLLVVLVDDHDAAAGLDHAAHLGDAPYRCRRRVRAIRWRRRNRRSRCETASAVIDPAHGRDSRRHVAQHRFRQIEARQCDALRIALLKHARKTALAAAHVQARASGPDRRSVRASTAHDRCADRWWTENVPRPPAASLKCADDFGERRPGTLAEKSLPEPSGPRQEDR